MAWMLTCATDKSARKYVILHIAINRGFASMLEGIDLSALASMLEGVDLSIIGDLLEGIDIN